MHNNTVRYVSAEAQAMSARVLADELTETETDYFRRGKNSNPHAVSKNANHADYMYATGFEALLGYLFLNNEEPRMEYLIYKSFDICDGIISSRKEHEDKE
jgi:ribonuclease-3 family protein